MGVLNESPNSIFTLSVWGPLKKVAHLFWTDWVMLPCLGPATVARTAGCFEVQYFCPPSHAGSDCTATRLKRSAKIRRWGSKLCLRSFRLIWLDREIAGLSTWRNFENHTHVRFPCVRNPRQDLFFFTFDYSILSRYLGVRIDEPWMETKPIAPDQTVKWRWNDVTCMSIKSEIQR